MFLTPHRSWIALPLSAAGILSAASSEIGAPCGAVAAPTSFDYLVLASMADSQHPISMASYRPQDLYSEETVQLE
jgi:hypothetical protein